MVNYIIINREFLGLLNTWKISQKEVKVYNITYLFLKYQQP